MGCVLWRGEKSKMNERIEKGSQARILFAAPKSGSGKTLFTCGFLSLCQKRGLSAAAMKCGPDYIDPMFHRKVLKAQSGNLDSFFVNEEMLRFLLLQKMEQVSVTVIEGVMGYYDGLSGVSEQASTYEVARMTQTPVILVVDGKGASVSLAAQIRGMKEYREDSNIAGVLLNRTSPAYYERIKSVIERECHLPVLGYLPEQKELTLPSRHLGLLSPEELSGFEEWLSNLTRQMEESVAIDELLALAKKAPKLKDRRAQKLPRLKHSIRIGLAQDEAFSFCYEENLSLLSKMGAEIVPFSPVHDKGLPGDIDALLLPGGYPENAAAALAENRSMKHSVVAAYRAGMPILAECGGFLYLQKAIEQDSTSYEMTGVLDGVATYTGKKVRFGYIEASPQHAGIFGKGEGSLKGHEFHYFDSSENGDGFVAKKPLSAISYPCMVYNRQMAAGFPHFYYYSNPDMIFAFLETCERWHAGREAKKHLDSIAKPLDSLGLFEEMIVKLCRIQRSAKPYPLTRKALLVLCGDHGVVEEGVTQTGSEVTRIVADNFAKGNSTVNHMARAVGVSVYPVDAGMRGPSYQCRDLQTGAVADRKIAAGTQNLVRMPAMTKAQCLSAIEEGKTLVKELKEQGENILAIGEMGIGNTTPTSVLAALLLHLPANEVTGKGAGLSEEGFLKKKHAVEMACSRIRDKQVTDPVDLLSEGGGFEIAMMTGICLGGMAYEMPIVLDGAISCVAALAAVRIDERVTDYLLPSHVSKEKAGRLALEALKLQAPIDAGMCLGEGTGALMLFPLLSMAMEVYEKMGTFSDYRMDSYERFEGEEHA